MYYVVKDYDSIKVHYRVLRASNIVVFIKISVCLHLISCATKDIMSFYSNFRLRSGAKKKLRTFLVPFAHFSITIVLIVLAF